MGRGTRAAGRLLVVAILWALASCGGTAAPAEFTGTPLDPPFEVSSTPLVDTDGKAYSLTEDTDKELTLVFFGYTHCPDICQVVMADIASALTRLDDDRRDRVDMVFVTTDPARDDAATLRGYLDRFDPAFEGLTGDLGPIKKLGGAFDIMIEKGERLPSGGYDVGHGTSIIGVLPDGTAPYVWTEGTDAASLAEDVTAILDGKVSGS